MSSGKLLKLDASTNSYSVLSDVASVTVADVCLFIVNAVLLIVDQISIYKYSINEVHVRFGRGINFGNDCYYSLRKLIIPSAFQDDWYQDIQDNIFSSVLYGYGPLHWGKNIDCTCLKTKCVGKIFGSKKDGVSNLGSYTSRNFMIYIGYLILLGKWHLEGYNELGMWLEWGKRYSHKILMRKHLGKRPLRTLKRKWRITLSFILGKQVVRMTGRQLTQDRDQWLGLFFAMLNLRVPLPEFVVNPSQV